MPIRFDIKRNAPPPQVTKRRKNSRAAGVSLIIAIIFVSAFMLVLAGLAEAQLRTIRNIGNRDASGKAFYLAEAVEELALYWAKTHGIGANSAEADISTYNTILFDTASKIGIANCEDMDSNPLNGAQPCVGFEVIGRPSASETVRIFGAGTDYFSAPSAGTGNAGVCEDSAEADADQACNWNRLNVGETVEIPLYYEVDLDGDGDLDASPHDFSSGSNEFKLRVRAPCANFTERGSTGNCDTADRLTLYPPVGRPDVSPAYRAVSDVGENPSDPVLIQWSISDMGGAGTSTLLAWDSTVQEVTEGIRVKRRKISERGAGDSYRDQNTEISSGRINLANGWFGANNDPLENFIVLQYIPSGWPRDQHKGVDLNRNPQEIGQYISSFENPVLRLSLVGQPQKKHDMYPLTPQDINDRSLDIPFLEYQVLTRDIEIADSKSFIRAWAQVGDFRKEFRKTREREATLGGFAIEQF